MSSLNGTKMKVGDIVHDVLKGAGQVVNDGGGKLNVTVRFSNGNEMSFAQDGTWQGAQRLYWKAPYIFQPRGPNDKAYEQAIILSRVIYETLVQNENAG